MNPEYEIIIFYKYTPVADPVGFVAWQKKTCEEIGIKGRILIAHEGINGTVEGTPEQIAEYESRMRSQNGSAGTFGNFSDIWLKASPGTGKAFPKLKVKARKEIVTTGLPVEKDIDPNRVTGKHLEPEELKKWIENGEDFEIIDMRNDYEYAVGHFAKSHNSRMRNFRDLEKVVPEFSSLKEKKVLTVCTYGVRCEKASGYLVEQGFKDVYQLDGGIGTYMKKYPGQDFLGSLYVFDDRMIERWTDQYEVIGRCVSCNTQSERYGNCAWHECHKQLIICETCTSKSIWCSEACERESRSVVSES